MPMTREAAIAAIREIVERVDGIVCTNVFDPRSDGRWHEAAMTMILILLKDGLQLASEVLSERVNNRGADIYECGRERDLTALITQARNAACHYGSPLNEIYGGPLRYNVMTGVGTVVGGTSLVNGEPVEWAQQNPFPDDVAVFWGPTRIMIRRNLKLAMDILHDRYAPDLRLRSREIADRA